MKKKPIAVVLTDTHQDEKNVDVVFSIFQQAASIAKSYGLDRVLHAGDIFDSRKAQPQRQLTSFLKILDFYASENLILEAIPGNHDKTDYSLEESFLDPYFSHDAFILHRNSAYSDVGLGSDVAVFFMPFFSDEEYLKEFSSDPLAHLDREPSKILITHIGINDAKMNNGTKISSRITADLFSNYDLVLVGHYHDPQELGDGRIKYIGASLQHNYGESYVKGLTVVYDDLSVELVPLDFPKYLKYELDAKDLTNKDIKDLEKEVKESNDHIRVVLTGTEAEIKAVNKQALLAVGVDVKNKQETIVQADLEEQVEAFDAKSLFDEFEVFCKKNSLTHSEGVIYLQKILK